MRGLLLCFLLFAAALAQPQEQEILEEHLFFDVGEQTDTDHTYESFDGQTYSLDLSSSIPIAQRLTNGTLLVRFRTEARRPLMTLFSMSDIGHEGSAFFIGLNAEGAICYENRHGTNVSHNQTVGFGFNDGLWHTVVLTVGTDGTCIYADGELLRKSDFARFLDVVERPNQMFIGRTLLQQEREDIWYYEGDVDKVDIHRDTFDAAWVRAHSDPPGRRVFPKGYELPMVDLTQRTDLQVTVDREPGQYLGHVSTVLLDDQQTLLAAYPPGHGRGQMIWKRSPDLGRTWSERLPVPADYELQEVPTLHRVGNRILLISGVPRGQGGFRTAWLDLDDSGALPATNTWSALQTHAADQSIYGWVAGSSFFPVHNGAATNSTYRMLFHDGWGFNWKTSLSLTGGQESWSTPTRYLPLRTAARVGGKPGPYLCEPGAVHSPDGKRLAVLYRANNRITQSMIAFSGNDGDTFSDPFEVPSSLTGDRHMAAYDPVSGRLVITFRDHSLTANTVDGGDWVAWVGSFDDLLRGRPGELRIRLMDNTKGYDCGYAGIEVCSDPAHPDFGTFVLTSYGHWTHGEAPWIACVRFKLADILP